jgi:hypothetical protein
VDALGEQLPPPPPQPAPMGAPATPLENPIAASEHPGPPMPQEPLTKRYPDGTSAI